MSTHALHLDRTKNNPFFDNWKLARGLTVTQAVVTLQGHVTVRDHSTDYLHTRAAVLHNHVSYQGQRLLIFVTDAGSSKVQQVVISEHAELKTVCEMTETNEDQSSNQVQDCADQDLQPSAVVVQDYQHPQDYWLASSGCGDLMLRNGSQACGLCFPLQSREPDAKARSFKLEAAFHNATRQIQAVIWAIRQKQGSVPAACEIFLITLSHSSASASAEIHVDNVHLLQVTSLPPHAVVVQPEHESILIASASPQAQHTSAAGPSPTASRPGAAAGIDDDDVDGVSPRTLQQAAERLAQFTSDQPAGEAEAVPRNEYSDLYNEVGPDNVGGMGDEPSCTVTLFVPKQPATKQSADRVSSGVSPPTQSDATAQPNGAPLDKTEAATDQDARPQQSTDCQTTAADEQNSKDCTQRSAYEAVEQIECDPHKVVALTTGQHHQMLLGLSNDIDCAVVAFSCSSQLKLDAQHLHSIPALAYVAAGKNHKKFTLLGHPMSQIAAAIVEGNRFSYVYKHTSGEQRTGDSQIIDMGLAEKSASVVGAALHWDNGQERLLVLLSDQLLLYKINVG